MRLTLITVNYKCASRTLQLLRSLELQTDKDFDVIVVDNNSGDPDREQLATYAATGHLRLDLIFSKGNRGFSGGNNLAIRKALAQGAQWVLLINPDTTVEPDFISRLRPHADTPALIGVPLNEGKHTAYAGIVKWLRPTLPHLYRFPTHEDGPLYAIGAGMLIHRDIFARVGPLDERYFLYFEDADFSCRARRAGVPILFVQGPVISHGVSQSTKQLGSPLLLRYHARNALLFNGINGPLWARAALPIASLFGIVVQSAKMLLMPSRRPQSRAIAAGIVDFYASRFGKIPDSH